MTGKYLDDDRANGPADSCRRSTRADPRSIRLDPGGERYFSRQPMGFRDRPVAEAFAGGRPVGTIPGGWLKGRAAQVAPRGDTCPTCGARVAFGCEHVGGGR